MNDGNSASRRGSPPAFISRAPSVRSSNWVQIETISLKRRTNRWLTAAVAFIAIVLILVAAMLIVRRQLRNSRAEIERIALEGRSIDQSVNTILLRLSEVAIASRELLIARRADLVRLRSGELRGRRILFASPLRNSRLELQLTFARPWALWEVPLSGTFKRLKSFSIFRMRPGWNTVPLLSTT